MKTRGSDVITGSMFMAISVFPSRCLFRFTLLNFAYCCKPPEDMHGLLSILSQRALPGNLQSGTGSASRALRDAPVL
jgi:hypothetical protein